LAKHNVTREASSRCVFRPRQVLAGRVRAISFHLASVILIAACAGPTGPLDRTSTRGGQLDAASSLAPRTLTLGIRNEVPTLAGKVYGGGTATSGTRPIFNAALAEIDSSGAPRPVLAEALPQLDTDSWRVFPDGRMETTYRLKPSLVWHDGAALSAEDFVFAYRVYLTPGLGPFEPVPQDRVDEVVAVDSRTLVIRWNSLYPEAGALIRKDLDPLPRHILERPFQEQAADQFANHAFWTREFVGLGPYRLEHWEPSSHIDAAAFDGYALGRPRIDRLTIRFIADDNAMLTNLLAGSIDVALHGGLNFEVAQVLDREWKAQNGGTVVIIPNQPRYTHIQLRPELATPPGLLDLRVRRALAHAVDRDELMNGLFDGMVPPSDSMVPPHDPLFAATDRAVSKYPYDLRRSEQLMAEAGYRKGSEGRYVGADGTVFSFEHWAQAHQQNDRQSAIMAEGWRRAGFNAREYAIPAAQSSDIAVRATFPGLLSTGAGTAAWGNFTATEIPAATNRWRGSNRGGWVSPEYDRVFDA
jgi:peptide/nickel transport system substrate-binding protein